MTGLYRVFDAAYPPASPPPGVSGVLGYIGGHRALNVWTPSEWQRFAHLRQFPAYVPDVSTEAPDTAAVTAVNELKRLGWAPYEPEPGRRLLLVDLETVEDPRWYQAFALTVYAAGFITIAYGSLSTVLLNAAADVWAAAFPGDGPALEPGQTMHAHQYAADVPFGGTQLDYSVVDEWVFARGGLGARHG